MKTQSETINQESLSEQAPFFEAGIQGLSTKLPIADLKVYELKILLLLARYKPGIWVALESIRSEVPVAGSTFSRSISKLSNRLSLISDRKSTLNATHKEVRLSTKGRSALKPFASKVRSAAERQVTELMSIPQTTKKRYLTGATALNIPSKEGTGDWHFFEVFQGSHGRSAGPFQIAGSNMPDTTAILGLEGVEDHSGDLKRAGVNSAMPIFAANHYRAMTDLIYARLHDDKGLDSYRVDDWFPAVEDKQKLAEFLNKMKLGLQVSTAKRLYQWMRSQHLERA